MRGSTAGLPDTLKAQHNASYYALLSFLDAIFSSIIIAPLVVGYWRGVWELMAIYVYPEDVLLSSCISTAIGIVGHLIFTLSQHTFERYLHPDRSRILYYVMSRVYTVCFAFVCVNGWRGPWQLLDMFTKNELLTVVAPTIVGIVALAAMRALRNVSATPFAVATDSVKGYFEVLTMFRVAMSERTSLYVLDCLFSVLVIGTLVVFVWRGAWALIDIFLFPENDVWSAWGSLIVGYSAVAVAFMLQPFMRWLCDRITGVARLLVADIFLILSLIGTINVWRGIWNLLNIYLLPDQLELSCWLTHWICLIVLILLGCSNSLLVRGVYIDAEEPAGKCVVFPCYYLRLIFQEQKLKQLHSEQTKTEMVTVKPFENNHIVNIQNANVQYPHTLDVNHKEGEV
ncbi:hypothetical protein MTP99_002858 [Tenebrio molitor]|uniref:uncharacterized protein fusl isoform X3 n=1 Tax=Tenebrio molitor TaxID=7067 RepID=UPI0026FD7C57|nr:hypothetical protein MTP99_002858 [Tenebrio molitor]